MGLDIYLNKYTSFTQRVAAESDNEAAHEKIWEKNSKSYDNMTDAEKDNARAECDEYDRNNPLPGTKETIELPSEKYPEHMFKIGYLRSSYNDGGINRVLREMLGVDLASIFATDGNTYKFTPDWSESAARARAMLVEFDKTIAINGFHRVMTHSHNPFISTHALPKDEAAALKIFNEVNTKSKGSFGCKDGEFFLTDQLKVKALIPGTTDRVGTGQCAYVVYEADHTWYRQAIEIIIEMCEWVLSQPADPAVEWVLHWSG